MDIINISIIVVIVCTVVSTIYFIYALYKDNTRPIKYWSDKFESCNGERSYLLNKIAILERELKDYENIRKDREKNTSESNDI